MASWKQRVCWSWFKAVIMSLLQFLRQRRRVWIRMWAIRQLLSAVALPWGHRGATQSTRGVSAHCGSHVPSGQTPRQPTGPAPGPWACNPLAEQPLTLSRSEKEVPPQPQAVEGGLAVHQGLWVSWQRQEVAQAPGTRVPEPPEKEQVWSRQLAGKASGGQPA